MIEILTDSALARARRRGGALVEGPPRRPAFGLSTVREALRPAV